MAKSPNYTSGRAAIPTPAWFQLVNEQSNIRMSQYLRKTLPKKTDKCREMYLQTRKVEYVSFQVCLQSILSNREPSCNLQKQATDDPTCSEIQFLFLQMLTPSPHGLSSCCVRHSLKYQLHLSSTLAFRWMPYICERHLYKTNKVAVFSGEWEYMRKHQSKQLRICTWRFLHNAYKNFIHLFSNCNTIKY